MRLFDANGIGTERPGLRGDEPCCSSSEKNGICSRILSSWPSSSSGRGEPWLVIDNHPITEMIACWWKFGQQFGAQKGEIFAFVGILLLRQRWWFVDNRFRLPVRGCGRRRDRRIDEDGVSNRVRRGEPVWRGRGWRVMRRRVTWVTPPQVPRCHHCVVGDGRGSLRRGRGGQRGRGRR